MQNYITPNFKFANMVPQRAKMSRVWDINDKEYIDLSGGIAVNALGHCNDELIEALNHQAHKLWHISNIYTNLPSQELAEKLVKHSFADKVFFCNSGAEANEAAAKLARRYQHEVAGPQKNEIITAEMSFHGRTLFTVTLGGQKKYSDGFGPLPQGISHVPFNDIEALEKQVNENTAAVMLELVQGESGVLPATHEYVKAAREITKRHNALLIIDEVQTGMGRTGKLFCYEHYQVEPDILSTAKALGGGFPIGAMLTTDKIAPHFSVGSHGSTFGGNALACAVGSKAFDMIHNAQTYKNIEEQSQYIKTRLDEINKKTGLFQQIRGLGLLIGAVLNEKYADQSGAIHEASLEKGVMVLQAGYDVIRFAPALNVTREDLEEGLKRFEKACVKFIENFQSIHE